jgi:hypothetical protein
MRQLTLEVDNKEAITQSEGWKKLGTILLPTGRIVACDPYIYPLGPEYEPFVQVVPQGRYPVYLHRIFFEDQNNPQVAHAMLRFGDGRVARWELATTKGQDIRELKEDEIFGYAVDAGVGCFMDLETANLLRVRRDEVEDGGDWMKLLSKDDMTWGERMLNQVGYNIFSFQTGIGHGIYPTYWGYDEDDNPVCLVTEFIQV